MKHRGRLLGSLTIIVLASGSLPARAQRDQLPRGLNVERNSGDSIQPVFDGWQRYPDGRVVMWFGYVNRNYQQELDIPVGPNNQFSSTEDQKKAPDEGQPTHFYPRRHQYVLKIDVPKAWTEDQKLTWTVTANGETCTAIGWLQPAWEVDDGVRMMNHGGAGLAPPLANEFPKITGGSKDQTTQVGKPIQLNVSATDDGIPKPREGRGGAGGGLQVHWILYRGPARVSFEPPQSRPVYGKPMDASTEVSFTAPGQYWLQAIVSDGLLESVHNVKVDVTAK